MRVDSAFLAENLRKTGDFCKNLETKAGNNPQVPALDTARSVVDVLSDRKAVDIILLDIRELASFADYFVICSGTSERQMQALTETLTETLKEKQGTKPVQVEGTADSGWVLMDYGDVIVHIFSPETRAYYQLERIWAKAPTLLRVQ